MCVSPLFNVCWFKSFSSKHWQLLLILKMSFKWEIVGCVGFIRKTRRMHVAARSSQCRAVAFVFQIHSGHYLLYVADQIPWDISTFGWSIKHILQKIRSLGRTISHLNWHPNAKKLGTKKSQARLCRKRKGKLLERMASESFACDIWQLAEIIWVSRFLLERQPE